MQIVYVVLYNISGFRSLLTAALPINFDGGLRLPEPMSIVSK